MAHGFPVSKTQQMVLDKLGLKAMDFAEAEHIFENAGITVTSKRVGRIVEPEIGIIVCGGITVWGEGDEVVEMTGAVNLTPLSQWMK